MRWARHVVCLSIPTDPFPRSSFTWTETPQKNENRNSPVSYFRTFGLVGLRALGVCGLLCAASTTALADTPLRHILRTVETAQPACVVPSRLQVAAEYFVPVGNDLPGVKDYNRLVEVYQKKDWSTLEAELKRFRRNFETSALQEAAAFLQVESAMEQATDSGSIKSAERLMRETLLLYPKSELGPVVAATLADHWLSAGNYERSLSLYKSAREEYPLHELSCVFEMGVAESEFLLHEMDESAAGFNQVLQKCKNSRLRTGAEIRLADIAASKPGANSEKEYNKIYSSYFPVVEKQYPSVFYSLGEANYQAKQYEKARYYYSEYLKAKAASPQCLPFVQKRLADVEFRTGADIEKVVGDYLAIHENYPTSSAGIFSKIHAFLIDLPSVSEVEKERRLKLIDEDIDSIDDESMRSAAYLEKGLVLLDDGQESSLDYLVRLNERAPFPIKEGPMAAFIRERLIKLLKDRASATSDQKVLNREAASDSRTLENFKKLDELWLKGSRFEPKGHELYANWFTHHFQSLMEAGELSKGLALMDAWKQEKMLPSTGADPKMRTGVTVALVDALAKAEDPTAVAISYLEKEQLLVDFVDPTVSGFWVAVSYQAGDQDKVKELLSGHHSSRTPLAVTAGFPAQARDYLWLTSGKALLDQKRYAEADQALIKVHEPEYAPVALKARLKLYQDQKQYSKAYEIASDLYDRSSKEDKVKTLSELYQIAVEGKTWGHSSDLLNKSLKLGLSGKDLAPFRYFSGRASYELSQWQQASQELENALVLDGTSEESAGARYRLGKCLIHLHRKEQARKIWQDLANGNDPFWSPLAQNEIKIMTP